MSKKFYITMFCIFVCLAIAGFFFRQPVTTCFNLFMASLYLTKIINT